MTFPEKIGYRSWRQIAIAYGIIAGLGVFSALFRYFRMDGFTPTMHLTFTLSSLLGAIIIWETLRLINLALDRTYPYERSVMGRIVIQLLIGSLFGLFCRTLIYFFGEPHFPFQPDQLFLAVTWALWIIFPSGINLIFFAGHFFNQWKAGLLKAERLEREKAQVQFDTLKNQLNPHFLFNALTSLNSLIQNNPALATQFLQHLSKVYRYVLQHKEESMVSLQTELEFIRNYIFLAETRFDKALKIEVRVDDRYLDKRIVPVTLQVLLENAFKHNVAEPDRPLQITITTLNEYLVIRNNLQPRRIVETSNQIGLDNLKSLYGYLTSRPLSIEQTPTEFIVNVPLV